MKSKKLRQIIVGLLLLTTLVSVGIMAVMNKKSEPIQYSQVIEINDSQQVKVEAETVVNGLKEVVDLNVLSVSMFKQVNLTDGGNFLTKKSQDIGFTVTGDYYIGLSTLETDQVQVNNETQEIKIFSKPLQMKANFEEDQTVYSQVDKEWYTVGDKIEISPAKMEQVKAELKQIIVTEMEKSENLTVAEEKAQQVIQNLVNTITKSDYTVVITYIK